MKIIIDILQLYPFAGAIAALILGFATDWIWCRWMQNVQNNNALKSGAYSVYIGMVGMIYTTIIISNEWFLLIAYWVGCFMGSYYAVKYDK